MYVLGLSQHHDSAATLLHNGQIVAFCEEERFSRIKHDGGFPALAVQWCLRNAGITLADVDHVAYFFQGHKLLWHAGRHFLRYFPSTLAVLRNDAGDYGGKARGFRETTKTRETSKSADDHHVGGTLLSLYRRAGQLEGLLRAATGYEGPVKMKIHTVDHHHAHAASALHVSPWDSAAIIAWDGLGSDGTSTLLAVGEGDKIRDVRRVKFPHSLGAMYADVTGWLGFHPTRDEGKIMGLAAYGRPTFVEQFRDLVHLDADGKYALDLSYFRHHATGKHQVSDKFRTIFGPPRAKTRDAVPQHYADVAYALQNTLEEAGLHIADWLHTSTGNPRLVTAGGVALNSVMNGKILLRTGFTEFFAQPAAADDGSALGAATFVATGLGQPRPSGEYIFLGPSYAESDMEKALTDAGLQYERRDPITKTAAAAIAAGKIIGWFQGRSEAGPRALGNRSILADPRGADTKDRLNEKIKHREPFRPFAPSCLVEHAGEYFASDYPSPVMLLVFDVLEHQRAVVPAITHEDGTARVQTVSRTDNPMYYELISEFHALTGVPMVVNTSFNDNEEPVVCTPQDAVRCYLKTDMDALALGPFWTEK